MTYLYERCTANDAIDWARTLGRLSTADNPGNFTPDAIRALFDYYEQLAEDLDEPIELDIIAWCCEWAEYSHAKEAWLDYGTDEDYEAFDADDEEQRAAMCLDWFNDHTTIIEFDTGVLIQAF